MNDDVEAVARAMVPCFAKGFQKMDARYWVLLRPLAQAAIAALRSLGWQKVEPGMVVVKEPSHDWVKSTLGHGAAMCRKCFITNREAFVLGLMDKCEGVTNDAADNKKPAP